VSGHLKLILRRDGADVPIVIVNHGPPEIHRMLAGAYARALGRAGYAKNAVLAYLRGGPEPVRRGPQTTQPVPERV
jgi:hypothetical protein